MTPQTSSVAEALVARTAPQIEACLSRLVQVWAGPGAQLADLERLAGGASQELWSFTVETGSERRALILRRNPGGATKRDSAAGMEAEARVIQLAQAVGARVPQVVHVLKPEEGLGSGFVMSRVEGEALARKLLRDPEYATARGLMASQLGEAAARIHRIDPASAGDLRHTSAQSTLQDATSRYRASAKRRPVVEWTLKWLQDNLPETDETPAVVHGDLRTGNVVVGTDGLNAVLDWELVHIGDPMEDLGWICVTSWRFGKVDHPAGGFGSRQALFAGYEAVSGRPVDAERVRFWEVMGTLRWGLSCALMAHEFQAGDRSVEKAAIGRRASETEIDLLAILAPRDAYRHA